MTGHTNRWVALSTLGVMLTTTLGATLGGAGLTAAHAKDKKWRNLAIAGAAVTGYGVLRKKRGLAIAGGVGTAYAYSKYRKAKKSHRRYGYSQRRYGRSTSRRY